MKNIYNVPRYFFIGSRNRYLFSLSRIFSGATLFVEPQDYDNYYTLYKNQFNIVKLNGNDRGFGYLLNSMLLYAVNNKFDHYVFCDDDILGFDFRVRATNLCHHIAIMEKIMLEKDYAQLMMSFKGHNWYYKEQIKEKIGAWCYILNDTYKLTKVGGYDEGLRIYNDWDISAKLIKAGYMTACYYDAMFNHKMKSQQGGAFDLYKKQEVLDNAEKILRQKYGDKCIKNKIIHNQKEIRFIWSKL